MYDQDAHQPTGVFIRSHFHDHRNPPSNIGNQVRIIKQTIKKTIKKIHPAPVFLGAAVAPHLAASSQMHGPEGGLHGSSGVAGTNGTLYQNQTTPDWIETYRNFARKLCNSGRLLGRNEIIRDGHILEHASILLT